MLGKGSAMVAYNQVACNDLQDFGLQACPAGEESL